jgi:VWFA-related protein
MGVRGTMRWRCFRGVLGAVSFLAALSPAARPQQSPKKPSTKRSRAGKLPRPELLDHGVEFRRDPATGELAVPIAPAPGVAPPAASSERVIRVGVSLVEVDCNATGPEGQPLRGLARDEFRLSEDGVPQQIAYFDASTEPLHLALLLDASPSVLRDETEMKQAARALLAGLAPADQVAVVAFSAHIDLELPFTADRAHIERAIDGIDVRSFFSDTGGSNIYEAVYLTVRRLFRDLAGRKPIVLLTDGQDSGLGLSWDPASAAPRDRSGALANRLTFEDVARALAAAGVEVYVISTANRPRAMTDLWLAAHERQMLVTPAARELGIPNYTLYLAELVRRAGGQIYFLREAGSLAAAYRRIAGTLRAQYTLGYYPSPSPGQAPPHAAASSADMGPALPSRAGWHTLQVELLGHPGAHVAHRVAYYVPAARGR